MGEAGLMFNAMDDETYNTIRQHIPNFEGLQDEEKQEISSFTWLWSTFEGKHCRTNASPDKLSRFAESHPIKCPDVDQAWGYFHERYLTDIDAAVRFAHLMGNRNGAIRTGISEGLIDTASEEDKLNALLLIVYRLRNNLFHGVKGQYGFADQLENFQHANKLLRVWIKAQ